MTNNSSLEDIEANLGSEPTYEFKIYYDFYISLGFKPIPCVGYSRNNKEKEYEARYKLAKKPTITDFTKQSYSPPIEQKCTKHLASGGWLGWLIPDNLVALDIENVKDIELVLNVLSQKGIKPILHKTDNGIHLLFNNPKKINGGSKTKINLGITVTFRNGGSNFLILAPSNNRIWDTDICNTKIEDIPDLPELLYPFKSTSKEVLLESMAFLLGNQYRAKVLSGYDDVDTSFMGWLVQDLEVHFGVISNLFEIIYQSEFDLRQTELMYERVTKERKIRKGGTFLNSLKKNNLDKIIEIFRMISKNQDDLLQNLETAEFPKNLLPPHLDTLAKQLSESKCIHYEMVVTNMLTIVSGIIGNNGQVQIKKDWKSPLFLWKIDIANSGYGKSPVMKSLLSPVYKLQKKAKTQHETDLCNYKELSKEEQKHTPKPKMFHYYTSDFTFECFIDFFESNERGIIIHKDEIAGLFGSMNQFKRKGNDEQQLIELYNAGTLKVDRRGTGPQFIDKSGAAILGGIQDNKFAEVFNKSKQNDGTLARFLLLFLKKKPYKFSTEEVSLELLEDWTANIEAMDNFYRVLDSDIVFSSEAQDLFGSFSEEMNNIIFHQAPVSVQPFIPKLVDYCARFAALIKILSRFNDFETNEFIRHFEVSKSQLEKAIELTKFFLGQTIKANNLLIGQTAKHRDFSEYGPWLVKALKECIDKFNNEKLLVSALRDSFNRHSPESLKIKNTSYTFLKILDHYGIKYCEGGGRYKYVIFDESRFKQITAEFA